MTAYLLDNQRHEQIALSLVSSRCHINGNTSGQVPLEDKGSVDASN